MPSSSLTFSIDKVFLLTQTETLKRNVVMIVIMHGRDVIVHDRVYKFDL